MPRQFGKIDISATWPYCAECHRRHAPGTQCPLISHWLIRGTPAGDPGVVWLKRPMPADQWPPDQTLPRNNTYTWWIRAHCGHPRGTRQFAFHHEKDADTYEHVFRENPCHWTRCQTPRRPARQR